MRILLAGGAGFLGSHLADRYAKDHELVIVDNLSTGRKANISHLFELPEVQFIEADITKELPATVTEQVYDIIANLASPASPPRYQALALETLHAGSVGVEQLLGLARKNNARFFHTSTSEVYGDPLIHPQTEEYKGNVNSYGPRSMYDESKRYAEALIYSYRQKYQLNTGIVRIFNTYGPRMDPADGRVVSNLIVQALTKQPLTIYGDGKQTRSFCYVDDLIDGFELFIKSDLEGPINLGNPYEFTIAELAEKIQHEIGPEVTIVTKPLPQDDPSQRQPDIAKAKQQLGWEPKIQLDEGLVKTIEYFRNEVMNSNSGGTQ